MRNFPSIFQLQSPIYESPSWFWKGTTGRKLTTCLGASMNSSVCCANLMQFVPRSTRLWKLKVPCEPGPPGIPFSKTQIRPPPKKNSRKFPFGKILHSAPSSTKFSDSYWRSYNDRSFYLTLHATLVILVFKSLEIRIPTDWDWPAAIDHLPRPRLMQNYNRLVRLRKWVAYTGSDGFVILRIECAMAASALGTGKLRAMHAAK